MMFLWIEMWNGAYKPSFTSHKHRPQYLSGASHTLRTGWVLASEPGASSRAAPVTAQTKDSTSPGLVKGYLGPAAASGRQRRTTAGWTELSRTEAGQAEPGRAQSEPVCWVEPDAYLVQGSPSPAPVGSNSYSTHMPCDFFYVFWSREYLSAWQSQFKHGGMEDPWDPCTHVTILNEDAVHKTCKSRRSLHLDHINVSEKLLGIILPILTHPRDVCNVNYIEQQ